MGFLTQSLALNEGVATLILRRKEANVSWGQLSSLRKASKLQRRRLHFSCAPSFVLCSKVMAPHEKVSSKGSLAVAFKPDSDSATLLSSGHEVCRYSRKQSNQQQR